MAQLALRPTREQVNQRVAWFGWGALGLVALIAGGLVLAPLGLLLAALVGLSLGLLGGGGSILTVPIFVYALGFAAKPSIAMSLAVVGATSLFGALRHWRAGTVNPRVALIFGAVAMVGTFLGARLSVFLSGPTQLVIFALVMLLAAGFMFQDRRSLSSAVRAEPPTLRRMLFSRLTPVSLGVGLLAGLVGVGGGFLIVPALVLLAGVPMKQAVGTSLLVIAMNSAAGFAGYLGQAQVDWPIMAAFVGIAAVGTVAGTALVRLVSATVLRRSFAVFLVLMGLFILFQNRGAFLPA